jgi:hypothetical protein
MGKSSFTQFKMEGWMKKRVQEVKFFQKKLFPRRYFRIDFAQAKIQIQHKIGGDENKTQTLQFGDIKDVKTFDGEFEILLKKDGPEFFNYPFMITTNDRDQYLYAYSEKERQMWVAAFKYVIVSTKQV